MKYFYTPTGKKCHIVKNITDKGESLIIYKSFCRYWRYEIENKFSFDHKIKIGMYTKTKIKKPH